jgi:RNA polymerase sigma factor (sigma-70 family)
MNIHISYKAGKSSSVELEFQTQLERLQRRLQAYKPDLVHFRAVVELENGQGAKTTFNLRLPTGQMAVQRTAVTPQQAVKGAFCDMVAQLTRHKEVLRGAWNWKGRRRTTGVEMAFAAAAPADLLSLPDVSENLREIRGREIAGRNEITGWINTNLARLEQFVDRELRYRVLVGELREDQISREEVVDEVVVRALSRDDAADMDEDEDNGTAEARPRTLEGRLCQMALQAIGGLMTSTADTAAVSLDTSAGVPNVTGSDEDHLQFHQSDEATPEECVIADAGVRTPEEIFANDELTTRLDRVLGNVKLADREAFVLYVLEGFTVDEIARIAGRRPEGVRRSIHQAREAVRRELHTADEFRQTLLQRSRVA